MAFPESFAGVAAEWHLCRPETQLALKQAYLRREKVCPADSAVVFEAYRRLTPENVKVVLLGQDPYPRPKDACGIAFMSTVGVPRSADSIFRNLVKFGHMAESRRPTVADLSGWLRQGVLLVNTAPTVDEGAPMSHQSIWCGLTEQVLATVPVRSVGLRLGDVARSVHLPCAALVDHTHPVLPSAEIFQTKDCFGEVNRQLRGMGLEAIDWAALV